MPLYNFDELIEQANKSNAMGRTEKALESLEHDNAFLRHDIKMLKEYQDKSISSMSGMIRMLDTIIRGAGTLTLPKNLDLASIAVPYMSVLWAYTRSNYHCVDCYIEKFFAGNRNLFMVFENVARKHDVYYDDGIEVMGGEWTMCDSSAYHEEHKEWDDEIEFHKKYTTCVVCSKIDRCHFCHGVDREEYYSGKFYKVEGFYPRTLPGDADSF